MEGFAKSIYDAIEAHADELRIGGTIESGLLETELRLDTGVANGVLHTVSCSTRPERMMRTFRFGYGKEFKEFRLVENLAVYSCTASD